MTRRCDWRFVVGLIGYYGTITDLAVAMARAAALAHLPEVFWPRKSIAHGINVPAMDVRVKAADETLKELPTE